MKTRICRCMSSREIPVKARNWIEEISNPSIHPTVKTQKSHFHPPIKTDEHPLSAPVPPYYRTSCPPPPPSPASPSASLDEHPTSGPTPRLTSAPARSELVVALPSRSSLASLNHPDVAVVDLGFLRPDGEMAWAMMCVFAKSCER